MFTRAERELLKVGRAAINLKGFYIVTEEYDIIDNPVIMVDLFTKVELESFKALLTNSAISIEQVEEAVVYEKIVNIVGVPDKIHVGITPAGVISSIARAIITKSEQYVLNKDNKMYEEHAEAVNYIEVMCCIIAYYTNTPYTELLDMPINEVYNRYAVVQRAFPTQVQPLEPNPNS